MRAHAIAISAVLALSAVSVGARAQEVCEDDELSALAAEHALDHATATELLERARLAGASHPSLHLVTLADDDVTGRAAWLRALALRGLGPLRCGEALTETSRVVVAAPAQGTLTREGARLRAAVIDGFREPVVYVRSGRAEPVAVAVEDGVVSVDLDAIETPAQVQLVAIGPEGPRPVAELAIGGPLREPPLPSDASLLTVLRGRGGAGPLRPNRLLARVAAEHAERVCESGHVAHSLGDGDAEARLRHAHVEARHVGEVVSRATDEPGTWRALARSPSHRAAIGDRRFTDVGIGEAQDGEHRCLVVLLVSWPRRR